MQLCTKIVFDYEILNDTEVKITSNSVINPNCVRTNEKLFFESMLGGVAYKVEANGDFFLFDKHGREFISLDIQL